jgi:diguanylate cyclase (GGDEF)-like protein
LQPGRKLWIGAASLTLAQVVASALLPRGFALAAVSDTLSALVMLVALLAFAINAVAGRGSLRAFWVLQAAGWSCWLADQCLWTTYDIVLRKPLPMMFAGDVLLFLPGVLMLAGLLLRPHLHPSKHSVRFGMLDFLLLLLWWIYFYVSLVMCWQYVSASEALYNRNFDRLYELEILVSAVVLSLMLRRTASGWKRFYAYLLAGVSINCLCFLLENRAIEANTYFSGSWYDTPYSASIAFLVVVSIKGRGLMQTPETSEDERYGSWMANLAVLAALSLPVIGAAAVIGKRVPPEIARFRVLVTDVAIFAMAGLVFVKQRRLHEDLRKTNQILEEASMTDPLTGIRNRRFFSATIDGYVAQTVRAYMQGHDVSTRDLIFYLIDMDNFKEVNDLHGHDAGDRVLTEAVRRISSATRNSDLLVRWGGEEFLIVSRNTNRAVADKLAQRVMEAVGGKPFAVGSVGELRRTCSIGWAAFPWLEEDVRAMGYEEVLKMADRGLSEAKRDGKHRVIGMTPARLVAHPLASLQPRSTQDKKTVS